jgi:glycosyltransferase involved in cell wall biosynthesis
VAHNSTQSLDRKKPAAQQLTNKTKIAVLIDWYLPGTKAGGPVRSVYSLVQLLKETYDFYILTTNCDLGSNEPYKGIQADQWIQSGGVHLYYFSEKSPNSNSLEEVLSGIRPNLIYLNSFWSYAFSISALRLKRRGRLHAPIVLAPRGMLGQGAMGLKSVKKQLFLSVARFAGLYRSLVFHATNEQEKNDILKRFPKANVKTVPNINGASPLQNKSTKKQNFVSLIYLSRISQVKNLHYALEVLQKVSPSINVKYDIYGNIEDESYWARCRQIISGMPSNITVKYCGELQFHEVQETARNYNSLFLPTLNENFGHSIVESLMCGCIVIISDQTPWTDVNGAGGYALSLGEQRLFVTAIEECARLSADELSKRGAAAIGYITKKTDLASAAAKYKLMFNGTIKD